MPIDRRCGGLADTASPLTRIAPLVGAMKPAIMRNNVVLPEPLGPRMVRNRPRASSKLTSATALAVP